MNTINQWLEGKRSELITTLITRIAVQPNGCWNWTGYLSRNGYGGLRFNGKTCRAHRVVYELLVGKIPDGLQIDHLCRNRRCVNPKHLEPVTLRENVLRGFGFTAINKRKINCPKCGNPYDYVRPASKERRCRTCKNAYQRIHRKSRKLIK